MPWFQPGQFLGFPWRGRSDYTIGVSFVKSEFSISLKFRKRAEGIKVMLKEKYPKIPVEQKHLDEESAERGYWHYGYLSALEDALRLMSESN
jgi:hypothetical protein